MRIALSVLGFFSLTLIILGSLFKMQHWPGAGIMLVIGISIFSTFFCLMYAIYRVIERKSALDIIQGLVLAGTMSIVSIGMMFKVQHWPGSGIMLTFGLALLAFVCVPLLLVTFIVNKEKPTGLGILYTTIGVAAISLTFAFNVSRETLQSFITNDKLVSASTASLKQINSTLYPRPNAVVSEQQAAKYTLINEQSRSINEMIESFKVHLIKRTDKLEDGLPSEYYSAEYLRGKDNFDVPTNILIGGEENSIRTDEWSAAVLHAAIDEYREFLIQTVHTENAQASIRLLLTLGGNQPESDPQKPWEVEVFYHAPMVSVLSTLSTLQNTILMSEFVALNDVRDQTESNTLVE